MRAYWVAAVSCAYAAEFAGPESCRPCHPQQHTTQSRSHHALALRPIGETQLPALLQQTPLRERSGISFEYEPAATGLLVRASQKDEIASALLEWAFGSGVQGFTPVGRQGDTFIEHRVSYYSEPQGARLTLGHPSAPSKDPRSALGIPQTPGTITRCFGCHATGVQPGPNLESMLPGVTCERCHGPAQQHVAGRSRMESLRGVARERITNLCGECHRLPGPNPSRTPEIEDPMSIRFAPVGLTASECYRKSRDLSCVTCHNPHQDLRRDAAFYTAQCLRCHEQTRVSHKSRPGECVACHMQQRSPAPYLTFTDHRIRIYP